MKTKLTLSVDSSLATIAHNQAKRENTSVSEMFSGFIRDKVARNGVPSFDAMKGSLKKYHIDYSKEAIRELYAKKYLD